MEPYACSFLFFHPRNLSGWWKTLELVRREPPFLSRCKSHDQVFEMRVEAHEESLLRDADNVTSCPFSFSVEFKAHITPLRVA